MRDYNFPDPDNDKYEITIPDNIVRDIVKDYIQRTYYWSISIGCLIIGFLLGVSV